MSIRCALGFHKLKGRYITLDAPFREQIMTIHFPSLLEGPPRLVPTGMTYMTDQKLTHFECQRCGKREPV